MLVLTWIAIVVMVIALLALIGVLVWSATCEYKWRKYEKDKARFTAEVMAMTDDELLNAIGEETYKEF